jgi:hypothetical protein
MKPYWSELIHPQIKLRSGAGSNLLWIDYFRRDVTISRSTSSLGIGNITMRLTRGPDKYSIHQ